MAEREQEPQSSITVTWGRSYSSTWVLGVTSAPIDYDGFDTITIYETESTVHGRNQRQRYVLIQQQHEQWHAGRYASGLFSYRPSDAYDEVQLAERMYGRMLAGFKADQGAGAS